ncbi:hypothetical protein BMON_0052 [Bifidobacterium mongoliense DSM 21395]|uniref:Uncharacterized protein n=1 Tax=Bifidobacterium mongoliense DSM 21395 TaxID=1437603 RepID=A0A087CA83_9BIFI|nr:hypothetical protein BMON_0052 [Bifidobacterium mongoliense DSM 21395]
MVMASRYSRSRRMDSGSSVRICSRVYLLFRLSQEASQSICPESSLPTMPPCIASTGSFDASSGCSPRMTASMGRSRLGAASRIPRPVMRGLGGMRTVPSLPNIRLGSWSWVSISGSAPMNTRPWSSAKAS